MFGPMIWAADRGGTARVAAAQRGPGGRNQRKETAVSDGQVDLPTDTAGLF